MAELKKCPFCGGEAELIEYIETVDGRGNKIARVRCKCGCEIHLTLREFSQAEDDFGYEGGYYSQNKKFWNGMHQRLVDKWNNRATESDDIPVIHGEAELELHDKVVRAKAIDEFAERCKELVKQGELYDYVRWCNWNNSVFKWFDRVAEQLKEE